MGAQLQSLVAWVGQLGVTTALAAATAYGLLAWLGRKRIEAYFARELEAFRAEKAEQRDALNRDFQRESDRLKAEVARLTDRATQLHRREYEVLPEAWGMLNKAFGRVYEASRSGAIYLHFDSKDRAALEHFIDGEPLEDHQKAQLKASPTWYADYTKMREKRAIFEARALVGDFNNYIILNGVFFDDALLEKMQEAREIIAGANEMRWAIIEDINEPSDEATAKAELRKASYLINEIKSMVRAKLFDTGLRSSRGPTD